MSKLLAVALAASCALARAAEPPAGAGGPAVGTLDGPGVDKALNDAEAAHREVRDLIARARAAKSVARPAKSSRAQIVEGLRRRHHEECLARVRPADLLTKKAALFDYARLVSYQACVAAETKSEAACATLSGLPAGAAAPAGGDIRSPEQLCRYEAAKIVFLRGLRDKSGPSVCPRTLAYFDEFPAEKASRLCALLMTGGDPAAVCARASAISPMTPAEQAECRALIRLRGASQASACAGVSEDARAECHAMFAEKGCAARLTDAAQEYCKSEARDRIASMSVEITAQAAEMDAKTPGTMAVEAVLVKRKEIDGLLTSVGRSLDDFEPKSDPKYLKRRERFTRVRAGVDATLNAYFGKQQKKK